MHEHFVLSETVYFRLILVFLHAKDYCMEIAAVKDANHLIDLTVLSNYYCRRGRTKARGVMNES